jgi:hypothetical protein
VGLVADRTGITGQRGRRGRLLRRSLAAFAVGGAAVGLFACYLRLSATVLLLAPYQPISPHNGCDEPISWHQ